MNKNARYYLRNYYWIGILLLPLAILLPGLQGFPYPPFQGAHSDISVSHYPNVLFLRDSLIEGHTIPLWSPTILSGYPFYANPLSGLWYPAGWLAVFLPLPLAFNVLILIHLFWAGIGMYLLMRAENLPKFPALFAAVVFIAMPKLFAHYGAGHLSLIYAIAWTPWLLLTSRRYYLTGQRANSTKWLRVLEQPAIIWGMLILSDVRWAVFAGLLWWCYLLFHKIGGGEFNRKGRFLGSLVFQTILGGLLAAPLLIPLFEYGSLSTRANLLAADVSAFSLPPAKILGLLFPDFGGFYEWIVYCGGLVVLLTLFGLGRTRQTLFTKCWLWAAFFSLVFALGSHLPFFSSIAEIPGLNLLRVPSRMVFITGFCLAALAAHQIQWLISGVSPAENRRSRLILAGLVTFALALTAGTWIITRTAPVGFIWGSTFIILGSIWLVLQQAKRLAIKPWQVGLLVLFLLDIWGVDLSLFTIRAAETVLAEGAEAAIYLSEQSGDFRVYSPTYSLPQQTSARYGLELASGVDPLQLQAYADFIEDASGIPQAGYRVVLPPIDGGISPDGHPYTPDAKLLGLLNVGYVLSAYPIQADGLDQLSVSENSILYYNQYVMPRAWVESGGIASPADMITRTPNMIRINAIGPGLITLAEVAYPGWRVWVDDKPEALIVTRGVLRSTQLGSGKHEIVFRFLPVALFFGLGLMALGVLMTIVVGRGRS